MWKDEEDRRTANGGWTRREMPTLEGERTSNGILRW